MNYIAMEILRTDIDMQVAKLLLINMRYFHLAFRGRNSALIFKFKRIMGLVIASFCGD